MNGETLTGGPAGLPFEVKSEVAGGGRVLDAPPHGRFPWELRAHAPGMDLTAIDAEAVRLGYLPKHHAAEGEGFYEAGGTRRADGVLAEFMAAAFGSAYDQVVCHRMGLSRVRDLPNIEGLLAFGYALCVLVTQARDPAAEVRPRPLTPEEQANAASNLDALKPIPAVPPEKGGPR